MSHRPGTPWSDAQRTRIDEVCAACLSLPPGERRAFVEQECAGDEAVLREAWSIVASLADDGFLETPVELPPIAPEDRHAPRRRLGGRIGPYKLLEIMGEGGFAVVYLALQEQPMRREVALKLIKPGMDSRAVVARFEAERQALAIMDHPGVARVFDGGVTEDAVPYFVMELVRGEPITKWCDRAEMGIDDRLTLFIQVCDAVQHAHQKGVIHRDLKPSNILVYDRDGEPCAKVIDFGIAKALNEPLIPGAAMTLAGQFIGTPEYMPPEQMGGRAPAGEGGAGADIDTRTDVYALGVVLYELLCGARPIDSRALSNTGLLEMQRVVREARYPRPGARAGSMDADSAGRRRGTPATVARRISGDLDWITMRCLAPEREERYDSVGALGADIRRHLANEPVEARPPSARYRLRKFVRRHRVGVAVGGVVTLLIVASTATIITLGASALRQANRSTQFMNKFIPALSDIDEELSSVRITTVKDLIDELARNIDIDFAEYPDDRAMLHTGIGLAYVNRADQPGPPDETPEQRAERERMSAEMHGLAIDHLRAALEVRRGQSARPGVLAAAYHNLGRAYWKAGRFEEARPLYEQELETLESASSPDPAATATAKQHLAATYRGLEEFAASERLYSEALDLWQSLGRTDTDEFAQTLYSLALLHQRVGRPEAALEECRRALAIIEPGSEPQDLPVRRVRGTIRELEEAIAQD